MYAERADDQEAADHRLGRRRRYGRHRFSCGRRRLLVGRRQLDGRHARVVVGHPSGAVHLVVRDGVRLAAAAARGGGRVDATLLRRRGDVLAVAAVRDTVVAAAVVRVTVTAREPVHQLLDRVHEEEARAHDELGEQAGQGRVLVQPAVRGQLLDALPDLGQQVQERGAQQHAAAEVEYQPEGGVGGAAAAPPDAQPLEHAHRRAAGHERRHAQERHGQYFRQHRRRSVFVLLPVRRHRRRCVRIL